LSLPQAAQPVFAMKVFYFLTYLTINLVAHP
jgi:hypothetical protein